MTTAARPTWAPAKGGEEQGGARMFGPSQKYSSRDMAAHTKLKPRKEGQTTQEELKKRDLKQELEEKERKHFAAKEREREIAEGRRRGVAASALLENSAKKEVEDRLIPKPVDADDSDGDVPGDASDDEDDDDDDEDDTAELLAELERIKRERAEEKLRKEKEQVEQEAKQKHEEIAFGNPLLGAGAAGGAFAVKRRWDDDVVFRNQAKGEVKTPKRFINDTIRSDFHRRFLNKYMK